MVINKSSLVSIALALSIVFSSMKLITVIGYDFRPPFFVLLIFYLFYARYNLNALIFFITTLLYLTLIYSFNANQSDDLEFFKSFALYSYSFLFFILTINVDEGVKRLIDFKTVLWSTAILLISFELIQICEQYALGTYTSWFWFDDFSISTATDVGRFEAINLKGYMRPVSFLYEPGFLGEVLFFLIVLNDRNLKSKKLEAFLLFGLLCTISALSILLCIFYYVFKLLVQTSNRYIKLLYFFASLVTLFNFEKIYNASRIEEIFTEGTSGYIRLTEPFLETLQILLGNTFGIPLGQSELVFNNSIFLILIYFGILTPFLFIFLYVQLKKYSVKGFALFQYTFVFTSILLVNGALFTPESALLLGILNYSFINGDANA
jgi:hypothetical protein